MPVADLEGDVPLQLVQVGTRGRARLGLAQGGERARGVAGGGPRAGGGDQHLHVVRRRRHELFGERQRLRRPMHREQAFHFTQDGGRVGGIERARLAVPLQGFAVQPTPRINVADHSRGLAAIGV